MNKKELVNAVSEKTGFSKKDSLVAIDATIEAITEGLVGGDKISLLGFGSFSVVERAARKGRSPATGETIDIPATVSPKFKPGKALKSAVKG